MPEFVPLPLHRYDPARPGLPPEWTAAPAGPYVQGPEVSLLAAKSPCNVVHVERLGSAATAAATLDRWLTEGILTPLPPGFLLLRSETPGGCARWGLLGGVPLADVAQGGLLRLKQTRPSARAERLARLRATRAQFAPLLVILDADEAGGTDLKHYGQSGPFSLAGQSGDSGDSGDSGQSELAGLAQRVAVEQPLMDYSQGDGLRHTLWRVPAEEEGAVRAMTQGRSGLVAGGHTALAAALALWADLGPGVPGSRKPWDYVLCCLTENGRECLPVMPVRPVHRVLTWFRRFDWEAVLTRAEERFHVRPAGMPEDLATADPGAFLLYLPTTLWLLTPRQAGNEDDLLAHSPAQALEHGFLCEVLGLGDNELDRHFLDYTLTPEEALGHVRSGESQAAFILRSTPLPELRKLAATGQTLPPHSVAFPPGLPSGLVFYLLDRPG